jgi:hypothetical protein
MAHGVRDLTVRTHEWNVMAYYLGLGDKLTKPFSYVKENARNFYETGFDMNNNITIQGGNKSNSFMLAYGNTYSNGVLPGNSDVYKRNTFSFRGHALMLNDKAYVDYDISFVNKQMRNAMTGSRPRRFHNISGYIPNACRHQYSRP